MPGPLIRKKYKSLSFLGGVAQTMLFRAFSIFAVAAFASVLASPIPDQETKALAKRGSVLSGQWDTESEVCQLFDPSSGPCKVSL